MEEEPQTPPREVIPIDKLPEQLGFITNEELERLSPTVIDAMKSGNHTEIKQTLSQYLAAGERVVEQLEGDAYVRAQIGLIVMTGLLWRQAGKDSSYGNELRNATRYARI